MFGLSFPLRLTQTGSIKTEDSFSRKKMLVMSALLTAIGERADLPFLGTLGNSIIFRNSVSQSSKNVIISIITDVLTSQFTDIYVTNISIEEQTSADGTVSTVVNMTLVDRQTGQRDTDRLMV